MKNKNLSGQRLGIITHGGTGTPEYQAYRDMKVRCNSSNNPRYKDYGGRGITICKRWLDGFENFLEDMGERPEGLTLERRDNDGNYTPENCSWESQKCQAQNRRSVSCGPHRQWWFYGHGPNNEMIIENSQSKVAKCFGLPPSSISQCLRGIQEATKGWKFQWVKISHIDIAEDGKMIEIKA